MNPTLDSTGGRRLTRLAMLLLLAGVLVAAAMRMVGPPPLAAAPALSYGPPSFSAALAAADGRVALGDERVARSAGEWANQESRARALLARYRLTGSYADLVEAGRALTIGRSQAPAGAGPLLTSAAYAISVHDLRLAEASLAPLARLAVPPIAGDAAEARAIAADIDLFRGRHAQALAGYRAAADIEQSAGIQFRIAAWRRKSGDAAGARAALDTALRVQPSRTPQFMAALHLARGGAALELGDWEAAERDFAEADRLFPGYWLARGHVAQMRAARGDYPGAERLYLQILRASPEPAVMDALASVYRAQGRVVEMRRWSERAGAIWRRRLAALPAAAAGHAIEHELVFGDPALALALAAADHRARPYGDTAILLAAAQLANGKPDRAVALLAPLEAAGWRTAQHFALLAQAHALTGDAAASEAARAKALALNPHAFDPSLPLIWFGHH